MTNVEQVRDEQAVPSREGFSRAWFVVLAVVVAASLIGQVVLLIRSGSDVNAAASEQSVGLGRLVSILSMVACIRQCLHYANIRQPLARGRSAASARR
jgi:hypothetical protein